MSTIPPTVTTPANIATVTETVTQTSIFDSYNPGAAACSDCSSCNTNTLQVPCNNGDWAYQRVSCCSGQCADQLSCSALDPSTCPSFPNVTPTSQWATAPQVNCIYQIDDFTQVEDVSAYATAFGTDTNYNTQIAPFFCSQSTSDCPVDPTTGLPIPTCSMYWNTGAGGSLCKNWATANPTQATATFSNYCATKNTPDCEVLSSPYTGGSSSNTESWWSQWGWMVVAIVVAALFIILLIWFIVVMSRSNGRIDRMEDGQEVSLAPRYVMVPAQPVQQQIIQQPMIQQPVHQQLVEVRSI